MANPAPKRTGKSAAHPPLDELTATRERERQAIELALAGMSLDQIAAAVGYADKSGAWRAIHRSLDRQEAAAVGEMRELENARLDRLQTVLWPKAMGGDLKAVDRLLRLFERRARLNGYDAPTRAYLEVENESSVDRDIERLVAQLADRAQDGAPVPTEN